MWRAFAYEPQVDLKQYDGATTPVIKSTRTFYNANCTADTPTTTDASNGNVGCVQELNDATLVRTTKHWYVANDVDTWTWNPLSSNVKYLVDRGYQDATYDGNGYLLALSNQHPLRHGLPCAACAANQSGRACHQGRLRRSHGHAAARDRSE